MPVLKPTCPVCSKTTDLIDEMSVNGTLVMYFYKCGHMETRERAVQKIDPPNPLETEVEDSHDWVSLTGKKSAYDFQKTGVKFIETTDYNCLVADAMGSGKTMQALLAVKNNYKKLTPCIVLVQGSVVYQWCRAIKEWVNDELISVFPVIGTTGYLPPGFNFYVVSRDTFSRKGFWKKFLDMGIKLVIVDEVQGFKDPTSNRSDALVKFIKEAGIRRKIFLSGTPIKNKATEYFTVLNLISPQHFPTRERFIRYWIEPETTESGNIVYKRLKKHKIAEFHDLMKNYIIRREKHEILKDLPEFQRNTQSISIEDPDIKNAYNREISLFDNFLSGTAKITSMDLLGWLAKFRHHTGRAKCAFARQWIEEFLDSTENDKVVVGIHHEDVRMNLDLLLTAAGHRVITLSGKDDPVEKNRKIQQFQSDPSIRVMVANIIAGGIGVDGLQNVCNYGIVLERQWNSADEEQFEARLHRDGQKSPVSFDYLDAVGTIDEFLSNMVEEKRQIFGETVQGVDITSDENALMALARRVIANPLR